MSIKLDKDKNENSNIKALIKQALLNPSYETEVIIGGNMYLGSNITYEQFKTVFNRVRGKSQFQELNSIHTLVICFKSDSKFKDMRVIINGFTAINSYCINEKLDPILTSVVFQNKKLVNDKINKVNCMNYNFKINQKYEEVLDIDSSLVRECLKSWNELDKIFRYKKKYSFVNVKPNQQNLISIDCSVVRNSSFEDITMTKTDVIRKDLFYNVVKPRTDKRKFADWWKSVKPSDTVKVRNVQTYHKTLKASKCFEADLEYELEIELHQSEMLNHFKYVLNIDEKVSKIKSYETVKQLMIDLNTVQTEKIISYVFNILFENIGLCLQCCQSSFYILGNNETYTIIKDFKKLINQFGNNDSIFFGPLPVDLNLDNVIEYHHDVMKTGTVPSICYDYAVSEKIDGERCLVYINNKGDVYCIDRNNSVFIRNMGLRMPLSFADTILDGEYVEYDKSGKYINKFYGFDCYFFKGKNIMNMVFSSNQGKTDIERLFYLNKVITAYKSGADVLAVNTDIKTSFMNFKLDRVSFYFGESSLTVPEKRRPELIFNYCNELLNKMNVKYGGLLKEGHLYSYPTDGLIFTPCLKPVYESFNLEFLHDNKVKVDTKLDVESINNISEDMNNKSLIEIERNMDSNTTSAVTSRSERKAPQHDIFKGNKTNYARKWDSFFKWKSREYLTMDLKIKITKQSTNNHRYVHYEGNKTYAVCTLLCTNYSSDFISSSKNNMSAVCVNHNRNLSKEAHDLPIYSINPSQGEKQILGDGLMFIDTVSQCYLDISKLNGDEIKCENGDIIFDGNVVEFKYDTTITNPLLRWKPLRIRHSKKPNALNVCLDIWQLMNNSLDNNTLCNYEEMQAYARNNNNMLMYLNSYLPNVDSIKMYNEYEKMMNTIYRILIVNNTDKLSNPVGLIMGCGNMSDYETYIESNFSRVVGIDNNSRLLNDKTIGAGAILSSSYDEKLKRLRYNTLLVNMDVSHDLMDPNLMNDNKIDTRNSYYLDILYGREKPSSMDSKKLNKFMSLGIEGYHVIIAKDNLINAMFENNEKLLQFIDNISKNLRDQGLFIGTYINGSNVCKLISSTDDKHYVEYDNTQNKKDNNDNVSSFYELKGYDTINYEYDKGNIPVGVEYERYVIGLSGYQIEYCVDFPLFESMCLAKGLRLVENKSFVDEPGSYFTESILMANVTLDDVSRTKYNSYFSMCNAVILQKDNSLLSADS
jgi:hypothetical protein